MRKWLRGSSGSDDDEVTVLRAWVEQLTQDNMRLRLSQQRPTSPGQLTDSLQALSEELRSPAASLADAGDEALHALAQAQTTRRSVLDVLVHLQVVAGQLERQLVGDLPIMEIDRRVIDRRAGHPGQRSSDRPQPVAAGTLQALDGGQSATNGHHPNGHPGYAHSSAHHASGHDAAGQQVSAEVMAHIEHLLDGEAEEPYRGPTRRAVG